MKKITIGNIEYYVALQARREKRTWRYYLADIAAYALVFLAIVGLILCLTF